MTPSELVSKTVHRRDIDGLRGIAVALVVLYHARPALLPAGYVGVDVFFVISGFLIVQLLVDDIGRGTFRYTTFLERRMRRILPALIVVAAATLLGGFFILGPYDFRRLGQAVLALSVAASNIYFWRNDDYFAQGVPEHPLLHTWSLGIEEQFYLLVPLFLLLISGLSARARSAWLLLGAIGSLSLSVLWTGTHPVASFYLLPTRAWELLLGGLVALAAAPRWNAVTAQVVSAVGLAAIGAAAALFGSSTQYPGLAAALPCLGAAAILWAGRSRATAVTAILGNPLLVAAGLVSYSLYLWHWPFLTLLRYAVDRDLGAVESMAACSAIVALAYLTWRFVETPFRSRAALPSSRSWWMTAAAALSLVTACAAAIVGADGLPDRVPANAVAYEESGRDRPPDTARCHHGLPKRVSVEELCIFNPEATQSAILVWGDSHANALVSVLKELTAANDTRLVQASYSACPPILGADVAYMPTTHHCREFNELIMGSLQRLAIDKVILAAFWSAYVEAGDESLLSTAFDLYSDEEGLGGRNGGFEQKLRQTVGALEAEGVEVWIVRPVPVHPRFVPNSLAAAARRGDSQSVGITLSQHRQSQANVDEVFARLPAAARLIDPAEALCQSGLCLGGANGTSFYIDNNHLSVHGASQLAEALRPVLEPPPSR